MTINYLYSRKIADSKWTKSYAVRYVNEKKKPMTRVMIEHSVMHTRIKDIPSKSMLFASAATKKFIMIKGKCCVCAVRV